MRRRLDNGEPDRVAFFFLEKTADATLGEKLGLDGKSLPPQVVEGITTYSVRFLSFPIVENE
jgi:hypothetical protein